MDQSKVTKIIKENKSELRQLTNIWNELKVLEKRIAELEKIKEKVLTFRRGGFEVVTNMSEKEKAKIKIGGND